MSKNRWLPYVIAGMVMMLLLYSLRGMQPATVTNISYTAFKAEVTDGNVEAVSFKGNDITATLKEPIAGSRAGTSVRQAKSHVPEIGDPKLLPLLEEKQVTVESQSEETGGIFGILISLLPILLLIGAYWLLWGRAYKNIAGRFGGGDIGDFLKGSAGKEQKGVEKVTFDDVAGQENAKREVAELVDFLRDPERFRRVGAEPPRGILLMGPPGTGKTLLARALAGEAGVPFFNISASEFIELFVGVGASRVRKMFEEAKKRAPSIIFIDELDSVGRVRGTGLGGGHDEREQTLNQILAEMDGFASHESVIVLAATNRPDVLDPALLRPGRFDRHVTLELPDCDARRAILDVHVKKLTLDDSVDLDVIAAETPGFSGADLKNLVNEAAIAAARENVTTVRMPHFEEMRDKVIMGSVRTLAIQPEEKHRLAVHEAGHTTVAHHLPTADPVHKVTIIPRGRALGGTHMLPENERHTLPIDYLKDRIAVMLGGRAAEQELLGGVSSGADDDIKQSTQIARAMVARWGMSEAVGPVDLRESDEHPFLGREIAQPRRFSEITAHQVDEAVRQFLDEAEKRAADVLRRHRARLDKLIVELEARETLEREDIVACLGPGDGNPEAEPAHSANSGVS